MFSLKPLNPRNIFPKDLHRPQFLSPPRSNALSFFSSPPKSPTLLHIGPVKYQFSTDNFLQNDKDSAFEKEKQEEIHGDEEKAINGIHVPRQKYISVPKAELLNEILELFDSKEDADEFARLSVCLDSILHAEHKGILEKMRMYYLLPQSSEATNASVRLEEAISMEQQLAMEHEPLPSDSIGINNTRKGQDDKSQYFNSSLDLIKLVRSFTRRTSSSPVVESRAAMPPDFQQSFMKLLSDAQFEELSAQDLMLTYALNSDYLLTLPIYVDWKRASESNAIIFRRGYTTERQRGLLIVEKLDYLQSKILQEIFFSLSRPLKSIGRWLNKVLKTSNEGHKLEKWIEKVKLWLKEQYSLENTLPFDESTSGDQMHGDQTPDKDLPIWLAAQRAIPRYEGFLSSVGPRGRLIRKFLNRIGLLPSNSEAPVILDSNSKHSELYLRPNFLPRITLSNIWKPATKESSGNNIWNTLRTSISILFSQSTLQEPAFQELILLYNEETSQSGTENRVDAQPLQLKIYEKIPIPDLSVIFPHKKLSFRILDTVRLDIASILGLLAYFVNYKFENIASSPSAILLDVIAISALVIYMSRVALGYKQTWDRYQLLVNKTLYEKTLASGFGSVYFLLDASEQQQYKEAILVYALMLHSEKYQVSCRNTIGDACERFIYDKFNKKIEMPIDKAISTLLRLDLVSEFPVEESTELKVVPCSRAHVTLKQRWDKLLSQET
ncbi:uncharacterized protein LOC109825237 isoform X1 [Asparagus officinalis]|uniref:uncharacterized protein LOC109825237 isoform X1 n=1 Tax=Asparagus officinalis TaxID=4686 RepID=UPI00098DF7DF|nr:uncharacterized protein LOC109825237 isoform X1 [Asparagus officinalis]XP_020247635.1 uncharacterized protein LOC109825237 isoform X1 [Asparagus officinalis]